MISKAGAPSTINPNNNTSPNIITPFIIAGSQRFSTTGLSFSPLLRGVDRSVPAKPGIVLVGRTGVEPAMPEAASLQPAGRSVVHPTHIVSRLRSGVAFDALPTPSVPW
jgi:hypothetical protein